jgi:two-component system cell cycle sensor histidine kinase/response regulator CckA
MGMSGHIDDAIVHHGVREADVAFLQKPFNPESLLRKVRDLLDGAEPKRLVTVAPLAR